MKGKLGCAAAIVYLGVGFVQLLAMLKGIQLWLGVPWILAALVSLVIAYIPIVGTIAGIKGATAAWGWGLWPAIAFFCGPLALTLVAAAAGGVSDLVKRKGKTSARGA